MPTATKKVAKESLLDILDTADTDSGGGAGNVVGEFVIQYGWKSFSRGLKQTESFVAYERVKDKEENQTNSDAALAEAKELTQAGDKPPKHMFRITIIKSSVKNGKGGNWNGNRILDIQTWTKGYQEIVKSAIAELAKAGKAIYQDTPTWGVISWKPDPDNYIKPGADKSEPIAYVSDVFSDEDEAESFAQSGESQNESDDPFEQVKDTPDFIARVKKDAKGKLGQKLDDAMLKIAAELLSDDDGYNQNVLPKMKAIAKS